MEFTIEENKILGEDAELRLSDRIPADIKKKYPQTMGKLFARDVWDEVTVFLTEENMTRLRDALNEMLLSIRTGEKQ